MYSKNEASQLRQEFWTVFGQYMAPILSAEGEKINWVNYKTGEKNIHFKMETLSRSATIAIEIKHPELEIRELYFNQFVSLKKQFITFLSDEWIWSFNNTNDTDDKTVAKIFTSLDDKSVLNKNDWPALISFFKPRIIKLDEFWSSARYAFELLH